MTQTIKITATNTDVDEPVNEDELHDALMPLGLSDIEIEIIEQ